jgi:hypothetical protein
MAICRRDELYVYEEALRQGRSVVISLVESADPPDRRTGNLLAQRAA